MGSPSLGTLRLRVDRLADGSPSGVSLHTRAVFPESDRVLQLIGWEYRLAMQTFGWEHRLAMQTFVLRSQARKEDR